MLWAGSILEKCGSSQGWEAARPPHLPWQKARPCQKACGECWKNSATVHSCRWCGVPDQGHYHVLELGRVAFTVQQPPKPHADLCLSKVLHHGVDLDTHHEVHQMVTGKFARWLSPLCWARQWALAKRVYVWKTGWNTTHSSRLQRCGVVHPRGPWDVQPGAGPPSLEQQVSLLGVWLPATLDKRGAMPWRKIF